MTEAQLETAVQDIWSSMLGLEIKHAENRVPASPKTVTSVVSLSGNGTWVVEVRCSGPMANLVTAAMFGMEPDEPEQADIVDAMGEIANMCSGAVKPVVDVTAKTGMPSVTFGGDLQPSTAVLLTHVFMESQAEALEIRVLSGDVVVA